MIPSTKKMKRWRTTPNENNVDATNCENRSLLHLKSCTKEFPIVDENILQNILSFVDRHQYRFVGSVSRIFHKVYVSLYPNKATHLNATTMGLAKLCREDIAALERPDTFIDTKDEHLSLLLQSAVQVGNKDVIKYLFDFPGSRDHMFIATDWRYDLCFKSAEYGQLELLQWAIDSDMFVDKGDVRVCHHALGCGNKDVFDWAVLNGFSWNISDWNDTAVYVAAKKGQLQVLQWFYELGRNLPSDNYPRYRYACCDNAAEGGHLEVLKWLRSIGCRWNDTTFFWAVKCNHVDVVKYMLDNGFDIVDGAGNVAAKFGSLAILQLFHSLGYELTNSEINYAASGGHLDVIEWALNHGCHFTEHTSRDASANGQLTTLRRLFAKGCPWDESTTKYARTEEIYLFAKSNGCPIAVGNPRVTSTAMQRNETNLFWRYTLKS